MSRAAESPAARKQARVEAMIARLRAKGLRVTGPREAIVRELAGDTSHPTAQALFERLARKQVEVSFASVYNTLAALAEAGLCEARVLGDGATRFDPNTEQHDHAICESCGLVIDVPTKTESIASVPEGFSVRRVERILRGQCDACARHRTGGREAVRRGAAARTVPANEPANDRANDPRAEQKRPVASRARRGAAVRRAASG